MYFFKLFVGVFVFGFQVHCTITRSNDVLPNDVHRNVRRIIIDTDPGIDDGFALFHLLAVEKMTQSIKIEGITCVNGNAYIEYMVQNVLNILKVANRLDIPVYVGLNKSITVTPLSDYYYGQNGFGDIEFPDPPDPCIVSKIHAVDAIGRLVTENPGEITIVSIAPLTNIALAIRLYPNLVRDVQDIYVLGGSIAGVGNIAPNIEFNIYQDPEAAFIVLNEVIKPVIMVPWETAFQRANISLSWRLDVLGNITTKQMKLMNEAEKINFNNSATPEPNWVSSDCILAGVFGNPNLVTDSRVYHVDVELGGTYSRGSVLVDYNKFKVNATLNAALVFGIDVETYKQELFASMSVPFDD